MEQETIEKLDNIIERLDDGKIWQQERSPFQVALMRCLLAVAIVVFVIAAVLSYACSPLAASIAFIVFLFLLAAMIGVIAYEEDQAKEAFMIYRREHLWCAVIDLSHAPAMLSRKERLYIRNNVHGDAKKMTMRDIMFLIEILDDIIALDEGGKASGNYDIDEVEEITKVSTNDGETTIFYTDLVSGEDREMALDATHWHGFLEWLQEQDPENDDALI